MLGIATISDPVQKPLLRDDLFDAEYSSSEDEADKPTQTLVHPQDSKLTSNDMELAENATEGETEISEENEIDSSAAVERNNIEDESNNSREEQDSDVEEQEGNKKDENELESAKDEQNNAEDGSDNEDEKKFENGENNEEERSDDDDDGEGSDDEPLARPMPMERAKSKKQQAAERQKLTRKVKQQAIEQIHSESQRIIRESKLSIPYHKPKPLSLNEFFSKKPTLNEIKAPQAVSRILQCNRKDTPMPINRSKNSLYNRMRQLTGETYKHTSRKHEKQSKKPETSCNKQEVNSTDEDKLVLRLDSLSDDEDIETNLPEINFDETNEVNNSDNNFDTNTMDVDKVDTTGIVLPSVESVNEEDLTSSKTENSDEEEKQLLRAESQDWSLRLDTQTLQDTLMPESDSEMDTDNALESSQTPIQKSELTTSQSASEFTDKESWVTPANKTVTLSESGRSNKKRLLDRLKDYNKVIPKLGGDEGEVINLDSNDGMNSSTGVFSLMERFVKHSTKKTNKRKSHVQLEVVKKEVNLEGKEELVHELVPVTLGEDEQKDPKLETPGAKLLKLKENLQVKMKAQREVERQRRIQAYKMDNEEGFEEENEEEKEDEIVFNEDEEAEESDGSEEDGDYIPDEAAEEDDDDDDDDDEKLKGNQFLDGEAEEDDDELPAFEINVKKPTVKQINEDNDSNDEFVFKIKKKKKRMVVDDDDEDEDEKRDETLDSGYDLKLASHQDTSSISSSSVKSLFKNPIRYSSFQDGRTMDLFDSSTNTTDPSGDIANSSATDGLDTSGGAFSFTPIKEKTGLIRHKSTDFANTPNDSDEDEKCNEEKPSKVVDSTTLPLACSMGLNSSFDNSSTITPYQKQTSTESDSNIPSNQLMAASQRRNDIIGKMGELTLPVEDSQDLFQQDSSSYPQSSFLADIGGDTQNLHLSFEENTQTQFLDENGFLKVKSSKSHQPLISKDVDDDDGSDMDELLGLCSGQFTATAEPKKGIFSQIGKHDTGTQDMDELLQLCSGTFTGKNKHKEADDDGSEASFRMLSDSESVKEKNDDGFSDGEEQDEDNAEEIDEDLLGHGDENQPQSKKMSKNNFVDEEAELSGSEFGSDEEYDAEEFGDLVVEEMLNDEVGNEDEIHNKIQKMHMKLTDDEDARRLRLYKEAFLTDGDLHDGTKGRTRQFRWRNVDDDTWASGANNNSDDEADEDENENETEWRKQRHEREQCLKDQDNENKVQEEDEDCLDLDENSQFDKFIKKVSVKSRKKSTTVMPAPETATHKSPRKPKMSWHKHGSFLNRAKNDLDRITNMFKPLSNPNGPRNARNFVFQSLSPEKVDETLVTSSQMKRPLEKSTPNIQRNKKLKLSSSQPSKKATSIFHHL